MNVNESLSRAAYGGGISVFSRSLLIVAPICVAPGCAPNTQLGIILSNNRPAISGGSSYPDVSKCPQGLFLRQRRYGDSPSAPQLFYLFFYLQE